MTTPTNSIILPSSDSDKQRIKGAMDEISASYTRIDAERDFIKDAVESLSEDVGIPKKYLSKMAKIFHKENVSELISEIEDIEALIETIS
jgi:ssDNA-specific exonuclease RecJ